jgi:phosphate transport system substrate-binding protein
MKGKEKVKKEMKCSVIIAMVVTVGLCLATIVGAANLLLINGGGATFPYPIYSKWFSEYAKVDKTVNFNYQSIGSGGGIKQITSKIVDFGATDSPMTDEELKQVTGEILHLPTVLGGVVPAYNIPGVSAKLNFSQKALAEIFLGKIKKWNDPALVAANPGVKLPAESIVVVHRSDGSGTTFVWTDFLSKVNPAWLSRVGRGKSVKWPVGLGGKGNEGISGLVQQVPNTIGYLELGYAIHNKLSYGRVENSAGEFIDCTAESVMQAAASAAIPADFRVSITNAPSRGVYPIASFTWLLLYRQQEDPIKGKALIGFLKWMLRDGQQFAEPLGYVPLPTEVIKLEEGAIKQIVIK